MSTVTQSCSLHQIPSCSHTPSSSFLEDQSRLRMMQAEGSSQPEVIRSKCKLELDSTWGIYFRNILIYLAFLRSWQEEQNEKWEITTYYLPARYVMITDKESWGLSPWSYQFSWGRILRHPTVMKLLVWVLVWTPLKPFNIMKDCCDP